ncbi:hypothetical protein ACNKHO_10580 [Shigella flexneri]
MSSSCIEEVSVPDDDWYRIVSELLSRAGIEINGSLRYSGQKSRLFKLFLQEGSLALGESDMDGWWECDAGDLFDRVLRAGFKTNSPIILKIRCVLLARGYSICKVKHVPAGRKRSSISATISSAVC